MAGESGLIEAFADRLAREIAASEHGYVRHHVGVVMRQCGMKRRGQRLVEQLGDALARRGIDSVPPFGEAHFEANVLFQLRAPNTSPVTGGQPTSELPGGVSIAQGPAERELPEEGMRFPEAAPPPPAVTAAPTAGAAGWRQSYRSLSRNRQVVLALIALLVLWAAAAGQEWAQAVLGLVVLVALARWLQNKGAWNWVQPVLASAGLSSHPTPVVASVALGGLILACVAAFVAGAGLLGGGGATTGPGAPAAIVAATPTSRITEEPAATAAPPTATGLAAIVTPTAERATATATTKPTASATFKPTATATRTPPPPTAAPPVDLDPSTNRMCDEFANYDLMQAWRRYWQARGISNPGGLDGDGDGIACEEGEGGRPAAAPTAVPAQAQGIMSQPQPQPPAEQPRSCCKVCTTGKACGNSCISRNKTCHQPPGCACDG